MNQVETLNLHVTLSEDDIRSSNPYRGSSWRCPVSRAVRKALLNLGYYVSPSGVHATKDMIKVRAESGSRLVDMTAETPIPARRFIDRCDMGSHVLPITFELALKLHYT